MNHRILAGVGGAVLATAGTIATLTVAATGPHGLQASEQALVVSATFYAWIGALVTVRRPGNVVGWLLVGVGLLGTIGPLAEQVSLGVYVDGRSLPGAIAAAWIAEWYWLPWNYAQFVYLPLLFPTGRATSRGWAVLARVAGLVLVVTLGIAMFAQELHVDLGLIGGDPTQFIALDNPVRLLPVDNLETGTSALLMMFIPLGGILAITSLIGRYRRASGQERHQITWVVYGLSVTVLGMALGSTLEFVAGYSLHAEALLLFVIPTTLGIALLSQRLYDIDRVISRSVSYALVTAVLASVYASGVLGVGALVPGGSSDLLVAGSTLAVAALFQPVRRRVQVAVDRRFNRSRYDAQAAMARFAARLRGHVDLEVVLDDLGVAVSSTLEPGTMSVWVSPTGGSR